MNFTPTQYEMLIQELHQRLIDDEGFSGIQVKHNVTLKGKSGANHQIDVCWELIIAGAKQLFCVECKYWKNRVKKEHVASFQTKLQDLGGAKGIFVTTEGYQEGAKLLAAEYGITLISTNIEMATADATLEFVARHQEDIIVDFEACDEEAHAHIEIIQQQSPKEVRIFDENTEDVGTFSDLLEHLSHDEEGYYSERIKNFYILAAGRSVEILNIRFYQKITRFSGMGLHGTHEFAKVVAKYILEDREISASLSSHRGAST
ncbi:restriction endonuclease [Pseudomonas viridiflava]|uniref:restriction endonuclease n=1 Tax=Pseudomonas viridiflava TaxID=33069 RepID=UPI000F0178AF|nr:restriction endonuclease [Pseudomonas viridiflava]